jgi:DNA-binding NarL/FixJ family response regulator
VDPTSRTLLVVEDDPSINEDYVLFCQLALQALSAEGLSIEGTIEQAFNYSQAKSILDSRRVDFVSIDIALSQQEEGLTEETREETEPGGISLLIDLQEQERPPLAVVVTGEPLQSYATDALLEYGVLAFYQKDRLDVDKYKNVTKAALWYLDALDLITEPNTELDLAAAQESWKNALEAISAAGINIKRRPPFPEAIGYKLEYIQDELIHSTTGLPIGNWTRDKLKSEIVGRQDWALIRVTIRGLGEFVDTFTSQEQPILDYVVGLLKRLRDEYQDQDLFIGHLGHPEHTREPTFVIIPSQNATHQAAIMADWIESEFKKVGAKTFASEFGEVSQPAPMFSVEADTMTSAERIFSDLHFLLDTLGSSQL